MLIHHILSCKLYVCRAVVENKLRSEDAVVENADTHYVVENAKEACNKVDWQISQS